MDMDIERILEENSDLRLRALEYLKSEGYTVKKNNKFIAIKEALCKRGCKDPFVCSTIRKNIFEIADYFTDNYVEKGLKKCKMTTLPNDEDVRAEYKNIVDGIIEAIFPYYGRLGFREKAQTIRGQIEDEPKK